MKIAFVLDDGLDKPDGVQQYILTLGTWFSQRGHEVHYLVGQTIRTDIPHVHSLAKNIRVSSNGNRLTIPLPSSRRRIRRLVHEQNYDVIHVQVPYSPFMGAHVIASAQSRTRVVGTFHILPYGIVSRIGTRLLGFYLRKNLQRFNAMVSVSEPARIFARTFGVESSILPNSVRIDLYKPKKPVLHDAKKMRILFLGRLVKRKGCQQFIAALYELHSHGQLPGHVHIDICGDGPDRPKLETAVQEYGLQNYVTFHGFVSESQKIDFMQKADISVFPSLSGESFGIVLIEAMAAGGGIVLAGDNPGYRSVLGDIEGSIIASNDPVKMSRQLGELILDGEQRKHIFNLQQRHVHQFDTKVVAEALLDVYHGVM